MLVGGGVEDDLRPVLLEDPVDLLLVGDVGQHGLGVVQALEGELVQQRLVAVEEDEPLRLVLGHLAGDLAADRAAGAGDDDGRAGEIPLDVVRMDGRVRTTEQVGDVEVAQAAEQRTRDALGCRRKHLHLRLGCERAVDDRLAVLAVGERDEDAIDAVLSRRSCRAATTIRAPGSPRTDRPFRRRIVVDEPDDADRVVRRGSG